MPVELDFWAQNLNRQYRKQDDLSDYLTKENVQTKTKSFSIFESE
ncbi:MAG TPA: hypothetical protein VMX55_01115 [candidate division Zixibacteria bacterium]|nr:hypothetical protein [candidate division Zixibacteria bacterium]